MVVQVFFMNKAVLFFLIACLVHVTVGGWKHEGFYVPCTEEICNIFDIGCLADIDCINEANDRSCTVDYECLNGICCVDCDIRGITDGCYCARYINEYNNTK